MTFQKTGERETSGRQGDQARSPSWVVAAVANMPVAQLRRDIVSGPVMQKRAAFVRDAVGATIFKPSEVAQRGGSPKPSGSIAFGPAQNGRPGRKARSVIRQNQRRSGPADLQSVPINDQPGLEHEADVMGRRLSGAPLGETRPPRHDRAADRDPVVQADVGFEFQLRNCAFHRGDNEFDPGRGKKIIEGTGWHLESDGGEPEYVVHHVPESDGKTLSKAMTQVAARAGGMAGRASVTIDPNHFTKKEKALTVRSKSAQAIENPVTADPQLTGGIRYERLSTFIAMLASRHEATSLSGANEHLMSNNAAKNYKGDDRLLGTVQAGVRAGIDHRFAGREGYDDACREHIVGILSLVASYLAKAPSVAYMKDFPLLAKSNLAVAITHSPLRTTDGRWFSDPDRGGTMASDLADVVLEASGRRMGDYVYPPGNDKPQGPTIEAWLTGLFGAEPVDLMSFSVMRDDLDASMGPLNKVDLVGKNKKPAPILELRRIKNNMPVSEWVSFAESARDWIQRMNDLTEPSDATDVSSMKGGYLDYAHKKG